MKTESDGMKTEFYRNLEGLSLQAVKDVAWRHYARHEGLVPCEVCERWFFLEEEGGSTADSIDFCGTHWAELLAEVGADSA